MGGQARGGAGGRAASAPIDESLPKKTISGVVTVTVTTTGGLNLSFKDINDTAGLGEAPGSAIPVSL